MTPELLADLLGRHAAAAGIVDLCRLRTDTEAELRRDPSIEIGVLDVADVPDTCSIVATHQERQGQPCGVLLSAGQSRGRAAFSLLHEYAHHLLEQVTDAQVVLFQAGAAAHSLEERMCDAFASSILIPTAEVDAALSEGVTAEAVASLIRTSAASKEATAVAAAARLTEPGYVMLLRNDATVAFAARSRDAFPVARGTLQQDFLKHAVEGGPLRGIGRVSYRTGTRSGEHHIDCVRVGAIVVAVAVDGRAPWLPFTPRVDRGPATESGWCEPCAREFTSFKPPCGACGEPVCTTCSTCDCGPTVARGARSCTRCFQIQPARAFPTDTDSVCLLCAG